MPLSQQVNAIWWSLGVGLVFFVVIYLTVRAGWVHKPDSPVVKSGSPLPKSAEPLREYPEGLSEANGALPSVLKFVIGSFVAFLIYYVVQYFMAMSGPMGAIDRFLTQ